MKKNTKDSIILIVILFVIVFNLNGCNILLKQKPKTIKPKEVWAGGVGQEPQQVWSDYDWIIVNSDRFICVEK